MSVATVSYVLNNGPRPVRTETRERVVSAMRRLNYHPNAVARSLVRQRTQVMGIMVGDSQSEVVTNNYYAGILAGVFSGARQRGYDVTFYTADQSSEAIEHHIRAQRPDAMLMIAPNLGQDLPGRLRDVGVPLGVVGAGDCYRDAATICLDVDDEYGTQLAMEHLWERGHRHIAYAIGDPNQKSCQMRQRRYQEFLQERGIEPQEKDFLGYSFLSDIAYQAVYRRLGEPQVPTALFAGNDGIALAALQAARDRGLRVPEDIAIVGFDDWPLSAWAAPGLTTIRQPMHEIGESIVLYMSDYLTQSDRAGTPKVKWLQPTLVVRGST